MVTLASFRRWRERFEGYALVARIAQECELEARRSIIRNALDDGWDSLWTGQVLGIEPTDDTDRIIQRIGKYLREHRNPLLDRRAFIQRNQRTGEKVDAYHAALRELDDNANYAETIACQSCGGDSGVAAFAKEERLRDRIICGLADPSIQAEALKIPFNELTLERTLRICRMEEAARMTQSELQAPAVSRVASKSEYKKKKGQGRSRSREPSQDQARRSGPCDHCGRDKCQQGKACPAHGKTCDGCGKANHFRKVCRSKKVGSIFVGAMAAEDESTCPLSTVKIEFVHPNGKKAGHVNNALPDTGSCTNLMGSDICRRLGTNVHSLRRPSDILSAANGLPITLVGKAKFTVKLGDKSVSMVFCISDE